MRKLAILVAFVILAFAVLLCAGGQTVARAESPTPTPTPVTVRPYSSAITWTYTFLGIPIIATVSELHEAYINGTLECSKNIFDVVYETIVDGTGWPWNDYKRCAELGVSVKFCAGGCSDEFTYSGADVAVDFPLSLFPGATLATAHFVHDGVPQTVTVTSWFFESGGYACSRPNSLGTIPATVSEVAHLWPTVSACSPPGADVHVRFTTKEFGDLQATFQWNGGDVDYDMETGAFLQTPTSSATPTPSESASPVPTPTAVPALTSGIKVMYTFRGIPIIILTGPLHIAYVNGDTKCGVNVFDRLYEAITDGTPWPWGYPGSNPPLCNQPNVSVRVCGGQTVCSDEFPYTGADVSVNFPLSDLPFDAPLAIAHFVHGGVSQTVSLTGWLFESGGYVCSSGGKPHLPAVVSEVAHIWPTISQCSPPGQDVHVTFSTAEFGYLHATFQWNSGDVDYDVDTGAFLQTPTPSPEPTLPTVPPSEPATPARLPQSGGPPGGGSGVPEVMIALAAMTVGAGGWLISRRRPRPPG